MTPDPVDEMREVIRETLRANALELVGAATHGEPVISERALDDLARGLLARRVAEPSRVLDAAAAPAAPLDREHWVGDGCEGHRMERVPSVRESSARLGITMTEHNAPDIIKPAPFLDDYNDDGMLRPEASPLDHDIMCVDCGQRIGPGMTPCPTPGAGLYEPPVARVTTPDGQVYTPAPAAPLDPTVAAKWPDPLTEAGRRLHDMLTGREIPRTANEPIDLVFQIEAQASAPAPLESERRPAIDHEARRELVADAVLRTLTRHAQAMRAARGLRIAQNGKGPTVKRGTGRAALTLYITDAVLDALDEADAAVEPPDEMALKRRYMLESVTAALLDMLGVARDGAAGARP